MRKIFNDGQNLTVMIVSVIMLASCIGVKKRNGVTNAAFAGISKSDSQSGVTQASPGANTGGGWPAWLGGQTTVPDGKSVLRLKVYDDGYPSPVNVGTLSLYVEYEFIESLFDGTADIPPVETLRLTLEKLEVLGGTETIQVVPTISESRITVRRNNHFLPIVTGVYLPPGNYTSIKAYLKPEGKAIFNEREYKLNLVGTTITFGQPFVVEKGKITSLRMVPDSERDPEQKANKGNYIPNRFDKVTHPDSTYQQGTAAFELPLQLAEAGQAIHFPPEKLNMTVSQITAADKTGSGYTLNEVPTSFEIMSLRNGYVGLAGHNEIPSQEYEYLEFSLGRSNSIQVNGEESPLLMENRSQSVFRLLGPYTAGSGRTLEAFIHIKSNRSLFYVPQKGYVYDPVIELDSTLSMTGEERGTIQNNLGKRMNLVGKDANLVIKGTVSLVSPKLGNNATGKQMIYSDVTVQVEDVLRGFLNEGVIQFQTIGGEYNGVKLSVSRMPEFSAGEKVVLFMNKSGANYTLVRGEQGRVGTPPAYILKKWGGDFPVIPYKISANIIGLNASNGNAQIDQIRTAGTAWSFLNAKSRVSLKFEGSTNTVSVTAPNPKECTVDGKSAMRSLQKTVYASTGFDPDCTSDSCSFKWSCAGDPEILHFDVQVNSFQYSYNVNSGENYQFNLQTVLGREFADILGMDLNQTDNRRLAFKFTEAGTTKKDITSDDAEAVRSVYGVLTGEEESMRSQMQNFTQLADDFCAKPCVSPDLETDVRYGLREEEMAALVERNSRITIAGRNNLKSKKEDFGYYQDAYVSAYKNTKISAEEYMISAIHQNSIMLQMTPVKFLPFNQYSLTLQIMMRKEAIENMQYELDTTYYKFLENENKILIQLRRETINEQNKR